MTNFMIEYLFDGHRFYDVVNAEDKQQAFRYLRWITEQGEDMSIINITETADRASYYCPAGWIEPETIQAARARCLMQALDDAGIEHNGFAVMYTEHLNYLMTYLGYISKEIVETDPLFGDQETYTVYIKPGAAMLRAKM